MVPTVLAGGHGGPAVGLERLRGFNRRRGVEAVHLVRAVAEHAEGNRAGVARHRQCRTHGGDAGYGRRDAGDLRHGGAGKIQAEDVRHALGVTDEEQGAVTAPFRIEMIDARDRRRRNDRRSSRVEQSDAVRAIRQRQQIGCEAIGRERDRRSIRRPGRLKIRVRIGGQSADGAGPRSTTERSLTPPASAEKAMRVPSGDQVGL